MRLSKFYVIAFAAAASLSGSALAQESRFHASAVAGVTSFSFSDEQLRLINAATIRSVDEKSVYYGARVGLRVGSRWGWSFDGEAGANNLGNLIVRGVNAAGTATFTANIRTTNWTGGVVATRTITDSLTFSARGGFSAYQSVYTITPGLPLNFKVDPDRGQAPFFGAGLAWNIGSRWDLGAEVNHYGANQKATTFGGNVRVRF